jgi:phosphate transport system protein
MHLQRQIERIKKLILAQGALVEEAFEGACRAVQTRDVALANRIIEMDDKIDQMEIDIEEECLHTLALYQPVAFDLRYIVAVMKMNNDLERIADLAVNIAEQAVFLAGAPKLAVAPFDVPAMTRKVQWMVKSCLDALVNSDTSLSQKVRETDDQVDAMHRAAYVAIENGIKSRPDQVDQYIHYLSLSRQLERIADHTVNIAEDVIYLVQGDILRHNRPHPGEDAGHKDDEPTPTA